MTGTCAYLVHKVLKLVFVRQVAAARQHVHDVGRQVGHVWLIGYGAKQ